MTGLFEKNSEIKTLGLNLMRGLSVGFMSVFFLTLLDSLPPIIYHHYLSNGIYNPVLFSLKKSMNYYFIFLLPIFLFSSIFYSLIRKRIKNAYLITLSIILLLFWAKTGYWVNQQDWFPDFFSIKGFFLNGCITIGFVILGIAAYLTKKKVSLKNSFYVSTALFVVMFILSTNSVFFLSNKNKTLINQSKPQRKVLFIGIDAAAWDIITPMVQNGLLPNLDHLMQNGSYGRLGSMLPTLSPVIWTSIATGKVKEKHGINDFFKSRREENTLYQ